MHTEAHIQALPKIKLRMRDHTPLREVAHTLFSTYRQRALVGLVLMVSQAFFYNAIFFTFALVLTDFFNIPANHVGWYILPFAAGNFLGPLLLGRLFDTLGRRTMIALTYGVSGVLLAVSGYLFSIGALSAQGQTIAWMVIFFFASPAASAAYLTVSETFPLEVRALAIALFYAIGTGIGGVAGPGSVRCADRYRFAQFRVRGLSVWVGPDDRGGGRGLALCGGRRAASRSKRLHGRWLFWSRMMNRGCG